MANSLFIGLVTHPRSRFPDARGAHGLAASLASRIAGSDWSVVTAQQTENLVDPADIDLSPAATRASIEKELQTEGDWWRFHHHAHLPLHKRLVLTARRTARLWKYVGPSAAARTSGQAMLERLANIERAHLSLMEQALNADCQWALILEDDAQSSNPDELANDLTNHLNAWNNTPQPSYVNMSESFAVTELGLSQELRRHSAWNSKGDVFSATIPFTNTVCAMLYRREFLQALVQELRSIPLEPIIPIDWKLNKAIMALSHSGKLGADDCYVVIPAPIVQGSMHAPPFPAQG